MSQPEGDEPWVERLNHFPIVLHGQAPLGFKVLVAVLQQAMVHALHVLAVRKSNMEVSIADREGYFNGKASFKFGIGNSTSFHLSKSPRLEV